MANHLNIIHIFPACLLPPPYPPQKIGSPSTNKPQWSYQLSKERDFSPHREALVVIRHPFPHHYSIATFAFGAGRIRVGQSPRYGRWRLQAPMAEMVWYFDGASEGWFRFRCWLVLVFFQQGGGGGEGGSCWFGWLENKEMLICSVCIYIVILHVYILVIHLQYIFMLYCFNLTEKKGWKSKKVTISSSQKSNT